MNKQSAVQQVVILADDFTGANDAGVSLAQAGMRVEVALEATYQSDAQALIYNSDSRALAADAAYEKVAALTESVLRLSSPAWLVKKIDSTLRGNPGAEVMAMQRITGAKAVIIAPAFPAAGRITREGKCLVNGVLLTETEFASDPKTPITSADVGALFIGHSQNIIPAQLPVALSNARAQAPALLVVDAQTDADLDDIITHAMQASERPLLVGSAGLCDALSRRLAPQKQPVVLAVVGSMSEIAQKQVSIAAHHPRCEHIFVDINDVFQSSATDYRTAIVAALNGGRHCLVHTCPDEQARHQVAALCERWGVSRAECGERICDYLGALTRDVLQHSTPDGLYLSGVMWR